MENCVTLAGQNLYRIIYKMQYSDRDFQKLVIAATREEACSLFKDVVSCELVEDDISMWIPNKYVSGSNG